MPVQRWCIAAIAAALLVVQASRANAADSSATEPAFAPDAIPLGQYLGNSGTLASNGSTEPEYFLAIYSGSTSGSYFSVASTICGAMQKRFEEHRIRCVPLRSQGVASNRELMRQGRAQVILVQSDTSWRAANGQEPIPTGRSVASLQDEAGLLVVRRDAGIARPADLRGKRINLGTEGSAARALWVEFLQANGLAEQDFESIYAVAQSYNEEGICNGYVDAYGLWIGHPTPTIAETLASCDVELVGMAGSGADRLLAEKPYYYRQVVPAGTYEGQARDLPTYGLKAVLVADRRADPYIVYWLTRTLVEDVDVLRASNPILSALDTDAMFAQGNFLPFHEGAERFWRERGVLETPTN